MILNGFVRTMSNESGGVKKLFQMCTGATNIDTSKLQKSSSLFSLSENAFLLRVECAGGRTKSNPPFCCLIATGLVVCDTVT